MGSRHNGPRIGFSAAGGNSEEKRDGHSSVAILQSIFTDHPRIHKSDGEKPASTSMTEHDVRLAHRESIIRTDPEFLLKQELQYFFAAPALICTTFLALYAPFVLSFPLLKDCTSDDDTHAMSELRKGTKWLLPLLQPCPNCNSCCQLPTFSSSSFEFMIRSHTTSPVHAI